MRSRNASRQQPSASSGAACLQSRPTSAILPLRVSVFVMWSSLAATRRSRMRTTVCANYICIRSLSVHALTFRTATPVLCRRPSPILLSSVRRSYLQHSFLQHASLRLAVRTFVSQRNKPRSASSATSTASVTPAPPPYPPSSSYFPPSSSSPADSGRLIFATTLTLYARGVPYLFLFLLLPLVSYAIYATYEPSTTASASPTVDSYLSILPLTVVPLSFLLLVAAFVRFNRRLIATIHLMPDRRLALTTMNMLPSSASTPDYIIKQLDALIPPLAWTGSNDRTLHRLRFVREGEAGGVDQFWLYAAPSKAGQQGVELLRRIMTDNRLSSRELAL